MRLVPAVIYLEKTLTGLTEKVVPADYPLGWPEEYQRIGDTTVQLVEIADRVQAEVHVCGGYDLSDPAKSSTHVGGESRTMQGTVVADVGDLSVSIEWDGGFRTTTRRQCGLPGFPVSNLREAVAA